MKLKFRNRIVLHWAVAFACRCWLQLDLGVSLATQVPIYILMIVTFTLIEAAGSAEYKTLKGNKQK